MDDGEVRALLEAASRELALVHAEIRPPKTAVAGQEAAPLLVSHARSEVASAQSAADEAIRTWVGLPTCGADLDGVEEEDRTEVLLQAWRLRASAVRDRDKAEARLQALRGERAELLLRLAQLTSESREGDGEDTLMSSTSAVSEDPSEGPLLAECEALEARARTLQHEVAMRSKRLTAQAQFGVVLGRRRRAIRRRHGRSAAEGERSREILSIQRSTIEHLKYVAEQCGEVDQAISAMQRDCESKAEQLQSEWSAQQARYQEEAAQLEQKISDLQQECNERLEASEQEMERRLEERRRLADEERARVNRQMEELDEQRESELAKAREEVDRQQQILVEARESAFGKVEAKLSEKRQELQARSDAERFRCEAQREKLLYKADCMAAEVRHYRSNIDKMNENYRLRQVTRPQSPGSPRSVISALRKAARSLSPEGPVSPRSLASLATPHSRGGVGSMLPTPSGGDRCQTLFGR
mmetsp:Transcript_57131/g.125477  ORF Transcript_57131/g.125477 Transcript_57131/m.125477 type:complete len:472 (+) Transcript_57131:50-1465(+)